MSATVLQQVSELVSQYRWDEAHSLLARHAQQAPNDPQIEFELGVICYHLGKFEESEMHLKTSLSMSFDNTDAHYQLGLTLLREDRPQEAMSEFREACERKADFAVGHLHWGLALASMNSLKGALGQFTHAIKLAPYMSSAYYQAGVVCYQMGQLVEAAQYFQSASNVDPELAEAWNGLGVALAAMGSLPESAECFQKATQIDPGLVVAHRNWANILANGGQTEEAIRRYSETLANTGKALSAQDRAMVYNDWAINLYRLNRLDDAAEKLVLAVDVDPSFADARINLGLIRSQMKEHDLAIDALEKAVELRPDAFDALVHLAVNYLVAGRNQEALEKLIPMYKAGVRKNELELWMGYANLALGHTGVAMEHFERAEKESATSFLAKDGIGCCYAMQGDHSNAVRKFQECLQMNREFALGHLHLARSLEALGHADASKMSYREAVVRDPLCLVPEKESIDVLLKYNRIDLVVNKSLRMLDINPSDLDAKLALAKALKVQNRTQDALMLIERILQEHPNNPDALVISGQVFLMLGRFVEADDRFRLASENMDGEFDSQLFFSWGKTLSSLGLHELALEKFAKASEIDPFDADIYDAWGTTLKFLGRFTDAAEVYKKASEYI